MIYDRQNFCLSDPSKGTRHVRAFIKYAFTNRLCYSDSFQVSHVSTMVSADHDEISTLHQIGVPVSWYLPYNLSDTPLLSSVTDWKGYSLWLHCGWTALILLLWDLRPKSEFAIFRPHVSRSQHLQRMQTCYELPHLIFLIHLCCHLLRIGKSTHYGCIVDGQH